jgi:hypothetical protein
MRKSRRRRLTKEEAYIILRKALAEEKIIELGWKSIERNTLRGVPGYQVTEMKKAFYMGAYHLFSVLSTLVDLEEKENFQDLNPMDAISRELGEFKLEYLTETEGTA